MNDNGLLLLSLKGIEDTLRPNGLVTALLAFCSLPSFSTPKKHLLDQKERLECLKIVKNNKEVMIHLRSQKYDTKHFH